MTERDVWQDIDWTDDGLSVTTYSQAADQEPTVEDEAYWTWSELMLQIPFSVLEREYESTTN